MAEKNNKKKMGTNFNVSLKTTFFFLNQNLPGLFTITNSQQEALISDFRVMSPMYQLLGLLDFFSLSNIFSHLDLQSTSLVLNVRGDLRNRTDL